MKSEERNASGKKNGLKDMFFQDRHWSYVFWIEIVLVIIALIITVLIAKFSINGWSVINLLILIAFQLLMYWKRIKPNEECKTKLQKNYTDYFGTRSYISKHLDKVERSFFWKYRKKYPYGKYANYDQYEKTVSYKRETDEYKKARKEKLEVRIAENKSLFFKYCFYFSCSFFCAYIAAFIISGINNQYQKENHKNEERIPLSTSVIQVDYVSSLTEQQDTITIWLKPSVLLYEKDGIAFDLSKMAKCDSGYNTAGSKLKFKPFFLNGTNNVFIRELAEKESILEFAKVHLPDGYSPEFKSLNLVDINDQYVNSTKRIINCISIFFDLLTSLLLFLPFVLLSYDTRSFQHKITGQWNLILSIVLVAVLLMVEILFAVLFRNESYIIAHFVIQSFAGLISVVVLSALGSKLFFLNQQCKNEWEKAGYFFLFLFIYIYAASQLLAVFEQPLIIHNFPLEAVVHVLQLFKLFLFTAIYMFSAEKCIDLFLINEINVIKVSAKQNVGLEEFYHIMQDTKM